MSSSCGEVRSTVGGFGLRQFLERRRRSNTRSHSIKVSSEATMTTASPRGRRSAGAVDSSRSHASTALDSG